MYEDNLVCIVMSINPVCRKYSCHIDIPKHYLRELCLSGIVELIPLRTYHMVTDVYLGLLNSLFSVSISYEGERLSIR